MQILVGSSRISRWSDYAARRRPQLQTHDVSSAKTKPVGLQSKTLSPGLDGFIGMMAKSDGTVEAHEKQ